MFTIYIGSDHAGFSCKQALYDYLRKRVDVDVLGMGSAQIPASLCDAYNIISEAKRRRRLRVAKKTKVFSTRKCWMF